MTDCIYLLPVISECIIEGSQDIITTGPTLKQILTMINIRFFYDIDHCDKQRMH